MGNENQLIHYRDILASIGSNFNEIPKPINPHLVSNVSRVPWIDFKLLPLPLEAYDHPDIFIKPGDLVRIWRPRKFVSHCGIYLGNHKIIHISNGIQGDQGMNWRFSGLFQSGSSGTSPPKRSYYDYGKKMKQRKNSKENVSKNDEEKIIETENKKNADPEDEDDGFHKIEIEEDSEDDDMDLVDGDSENDDECKMDEYHQQKTRGQQTEQKEMKTNDQLLLYQDIDDEEPSKMNGIEMEYARRARECEWSEFLLGSRKKDLELGFFVFPWRTPSEIVYTARFLTEIHYMKGQYSVYRNNCEHFALFCCSGLRYSPQANTIENIVNYASKVGAFASSIFNKATSFRKKSIEQNENENKNQHQNHSNHPVIKDQELDDGGDEELEKILLDGDNGDVLVMGDQQNKNKKKKKNPKILNKPKINGRGIRKKKNKLKKNKKEKKNDLLMENEDKLVLDEYDDDEDDVFAENVDMDIDEDLSHFDMTPGGMTKSEVLVAKKYHNQQQKKWDV